MARHSLECSCDLGELWGGWDWDLVLVEAQFSRNPPNTSVKPRFA